MRLLRVIVPVDLLGTSSNFNLYSFLLRMLAENETDDYGGTIATVRNYVAGPNGFRGTSHGQRAKGC